jgi:protein gp138
MDQRERWNDPEEALRTFLDGWQRKLWTAMPGIVQSFDPVDGTVAVQPAINAMVRNTQGVISSQALPQLIKCPVVNMGGGGFSVTMPIAAGDEALVVFGSRCIDSWWQSGGVQNPIEWRMHNLSDGFAIVGTRSKARALSGVSSTSMQIRSDDGDMYIELAAGHVTNIVAPGGVNIIGPLNVTGATTITGATAITGALTATQNITAGEGGADQVTLQDHIHGTGTAAAGTSVPTPGH